MFKDNDNEHAKYIKEIKSVENSVKQKDEQISLSKDVHVNNNENKKQIQQQQPNENNIKKKDWKENLKKLEVVEEEVQNVKQGQGKEMHGDGKMAKAVESKDIKDSLLTTREMNESLIIDLITDKQQNSSAQEAKQINMAAIKERQNANHQLLLEQQQQHQHQHQQPSVEMGNILREYIPNEKDSKQQQQQRHQQEEEEDYERKITTVVDDEISTQPTSDNHNDNYKSYDENNENNDDEILKHLQILNNQQHYKNNSNNIEQLIIITTTTTLTEDPLLNSSDIRETTRAAKILLNELQVNEQQQEKSIAYAEENQSEEEKENAENPKPSAAAEAVTSTEGMKEEEEEVITTTTTNTTCLTTACKTFNDNINVEGKILQINVEKDKMKYDDVDVNVNENFEEDLMNKDNEPKYVTVKNADFPDAVKNIDKNSNFTDNNITSSETIHMDNLNNHHFKEFKIMNNLNHHTIFNETIKIGQIIDKEDGEDKNKEIFDDKIIDVPLIDNMMSNNDTNNKDNFKVKAKNSEKYDDIASELGSGVTAIADLVGHNINNNYIESKQNSSIDYRNDDDDDDDGDDVVMDLYNNNVVHDFDIIIKPTTTTKTSIIKETYENNINNNSIILSDADKFNLNDQQQIEQPLQLKTTTTTTTTTTAKAVAEKTINLSIKKKSIKSKMMVINEQTTLTDSSDNLVEKQKSLANENQINKLNENAKHFTIDNAQNLDEEEKNLLMTTTLKFNDDKNEDDEETDEVEYNEDNELNKLTPKHLLLDELIPNDGPQNHNGNLKRTAIANSNDIMNYDDQNSGADNIEFVKLEDLTKNTSLHDDVIYKTIKPDFNTPPAPIVSETFDKPGKRILVNVTIDTGDADGSIYTLHVAVPRGRDRENEEQNVEQILKLEHKPIIKNENHKFLSESLKVSPYCVPEPPPPIPECPCNCAEFHNIPDETFYKLDEEHFSQNNKIIIHENHEYDENQNNNDNNNNLLENDSLTITTTIDPLLTDKMTTILNTTLSNSVNLTMHENKTLADAAADDVDNNNNNNNNNDDNGGGVDVGNHACPDVMPILILEGVWFLCLLLLLTTNSFFNRKFYKHQKI